MRSCPSSGASPRRAWPSPLLNQERDALYARVDDPNNGAPEYLQAFAQFREPADAARQAMLEQELSSVAQNGWGDVSAEAVAWTDRNRPALARIRAANAKSFALLPRVKDMSQQLSVPVLQARNAARACWWPPAAMPSRAAILGRRSPRTLRSSGWGRVWKPIGR